MNLAGVDQSANTQTVGAAGQGATGRSGGVGGVGASGGAGGLGGVGAGADDGLAGVSQSKSSAGNRGTNAANGVAGKAGTTNGQPIDSSGGSVSTQALALAVTAPAPGSVVAGAGFGMTISIENSQGQVDTSFEGPVTAVLSTNPTAATLGGTVTLDAHNGVAVFSGLTVNLAGSGYAIAAESGGVTSNADHLVVTGSTLPPPPPPPPPKVMGSPKLVQSKQGVKSISVDFDEALNSASASTRGFYHVFAAVKKKHRTVYTQTVKIKSVVYNTAADSVTINLSKPHKGAAEVTIAGMIEALDGASVDIDYTAIIK